MNFTEEKRAELEEQYKDIDPKLIQIQILMELSAIRRALTQPEQEENEEVTTYVCTACGDTVPAEKRQAHAEQQHNAPADMPVEDLGLFAEQ